MPEESVAEERIAVALLRLLDVKAFDRISITEITDKAAVSRVSYYRHFSSKEDILVKHFGYVLDRIIADLRGGKIRTGYDFWKRLYVDLSETNFVTNMQKAGLEDSYFQVFETKMAVIFSDIMRVNLSEKINVVLMEFFIGGITALLRKPALINHRITDEDVAVFLQRLDEVVKSSRER